MGTISLEHNFRVEGVMSGSEGIFLVFAVVVIWGLESIRKTLKECLKVLEEIRSK